MFGKGWTSEYYDALTFYFWEPQHLGRAKSEKSRYRRPEEMLEHIQNMEVSLNHLFNFFFQLAPSDLASRILNQAFHSERTEELQLRSRWDIERYCNLVQPDLMFSGPNANFSIEMKVNVKSSEEQVLKYAMLHALTEDYEERQKDSYLLFLGRKDFQSLWTKKIPSPNDLMESVLDWDATDLFRKVSEKESIEVSPEKVKASLRKTKFSYWKYKDLAHCVYKYLESIENVPGPSESCVKLINGLIGELKERKLT